MQISSLPLCPKCCGPLLLVVSDAAGQLFGCRLCRAITHGDRPPAISRTEERKLRPRERRTRARFGLKRRRGARSIPAVQTRTIHTYLEMMLVRPEAADAYSLREPQEVVPGWTLARWERDYPSPDVLTWKVVPFIKVSVVQVTEGKLWPEMPALRYEEHSCMLFGWRDFGTYLTVDREAPGSATQAAFRCVERMRRVAVQGFWAQIRAVESAR